MDVLVGSQAQRLVRVIGTDAEACIGAEVVRSSASFAPSRTWPTTWLPNTGAHTNIRSKQGESRQMSYSHPTGQAGSLDIMCIIGARGFRSEGLFVARSLLAQPDLKVVGVPR